MSHYCFAIDSYEKSGMQAARSPVRCLRIGAPIALLSAIVWASAALMPQAALAGPVSLDGAWSGGGSVIFPSGAREAARCRANFKKRSGTTYLVNARCASASGKIEQSATLTNVGGNRYSGSFFNEEFRVDGTITVTISGNVQNVLISSPAGSSAQFRLSR